MTRLFSLGANSPLRAFSRGSGLQAVRLSSTTAMQIHQCRRKLDLGGYALRRSARRDLNPRPSAWEADTLPLSYSRPWPLGSGAIDDTQLQHGCQLLRCWQKVKRHRQHGVECQELHAFQPVGFAILRNETENPY